ncbi:MAG: sugar kinase [Burkholderiaceae bacterium]
MDIVAIGEPMIEFNQRPGTSLYLRGFGGDTSNFSCAAARVGARVGILTRIGADEFGDELLALWRREHVDASAVERDPDAPTGLYFVSHGPDGHRFTYRRAGSAASRMKPSPAFDERVAAARWLHVSGVSQAISDSACDTVFAALACARAHRVPVSYDLNFRPRLWPAARARAIAEATLADVDLFLPSLDEAEALFGLVDADALIDHAHRLGARRVAVKRGPAGARISDGRQRIDIPGFAVDSVDATGAGDCFAGVLVARLVAGDDLAAAARAACAAAALSTTGYGAVDPLPTWPAVRARLDGDARSRSS